MANCRDPHRSSLTTDTTLTQSRLAAPFLASFVSLGAIRDDLAATGDRTLRRGSDTARRRGWGLEGRPARCRSEPRNPALMPKSKMTNAPPCPSCKSNRTVKTFEHLGEELFFCARCEHTWSVKLGKRDKTSKRQ